MYQREDLQDQFKLLLKDVEKRKSTWNSLLRRLPAELAAFGAIVHICGDFSTSSGTGFYVPPPYALLRQLSTTGVSASSHCGRALAPYWRSGSSTSNLVVQKWVQDLGEEILRKIDLSQWEGA